MWRPGLGDAAKDDSETQPALRRRARLVPKIVLGTLTILVIIGAYWVYTLAPAERQPDAHAAAAEGRGGSAGGSILDGSLTETSAGKACSGSSSVSSSAWPSPS